MANRVLKRLQTRAILIFTLSGVVAILWFGEILGHWSLPRLVRPNHVGMMLIWVPIFAGQAYLFVNLRRIKRRLRETRGSLCPACTYDLRGSDAQGACPECGAPYDADAIGKAWKDVDWKA